MARCVVVRRCVVRNLGASQFVDVAVPVDADVVGDVDPSQLVLVVPLILSEMVWGITVVAENHGLVVEGHTSDDLSPAARACRLGAPGVAAQHDSRSCGWRRCRRGRWRRWWECGRGRRRGWRTGRTRTRASRGLGDRLRTPAHHGRHARATGQPEQSTTADGFRAAVLPGGGKCVHDGHHTKPSRRWARLQVKEPAK